MRTDRVRLAVVGAGLGSAPHFKSLADLADEVELVWLYGRDMARLQAARLPSTVIRTTRLDDLLSDPQLHGALVLTPPNTHLELVTALAGAGKHVLVEKPLEVTLQRATRLVEVCEQGGVKLAVMLQHRLREAAVALRGLIEAGELGALTSVSASVRWWRPQSYYDEPGRGTLARDGGGVLMTQAIHTIDLLLSLTGKPDRVTGLARTSPVHQMETEDTACALLQYPQGAIGVLQATTAACPGYPERIEVNGTLGSATLESGVLQVHWTNGRTLQAGEKQAGGSGASVMGFDHAPHRAVISDFAQAIREDRTPRVSGRSAIAAQQLIDAVIRSSAAGKPVAFTA